MRLKRLRWWSSALCFAAFLVLCIPARLGAQGGEPQYFAIRGARVVPVSGPPSDNATVVVSRGIITAVGKDAAVPPEAWARGAAAGRSRREVPKTALAPRLGGARPTKSASATSGLKPGATPVSLPSSALPKAASSLARRPF